MYFYKCIYIWNFCNLHWTTLTAEKRIFFQNYRLEKQSIGGDKRGETYCVLRSTVSVSGRNNGLFFYGFSNVTCINLLNVYPLARRIVFLRLILQNEAKTLFTAEFGSCVLHIIRINTVACRVYRRCIILQYVLSNKQSDNSASSANKNAWKTTTASCNLFVI